MTCRWCTNEASVKVMRNNRDIYAFNGIDVCEFHAIRTIEAGGSIVGDDNGTRAAALIARKAVLRVRGVAK